MFSPDHWIVTGYAVREGWEHMIEDAVGHDGIFGMCMNEHRT